MKKTLNEELNRMKHLFGIKGGELMSESKIIRTYLNEQTSATFTANFSNWPNDDTVGNVTYDNEKLFVNVFTTSSRFLGPQTIEKEIPAEESKEYKKPGSKEISIEGQSFQPNLVSIDEQTINSLKQSAGSLVETLKDIHDFDPKNSLSNITKFLNKGFRLEAHADGSVPTATMKNRDVVRDHRLYSKKGLYGGERTPYKRNEWLAKSRGLNAYRIFLNELKNLVYKSFNDEKIIDKILEILSLGTGYTTFKVVNHLNQDGSQNPSEIGPQFRKFDMIQTFLVDIPIEKTKTTPGRTEKVREKGTEEGIVKLPIEFGGENFVEVYQAEDEAIKGSVWFGISKSDMESGKIPKIGKGEFNGNQKVNGQITNGNIYIDDFNFGRLKETSGNKDEHSVAPGLLCIDMTNNNPRIFGEKEYFQLRYCKASLYRS